MKNYDILFNNEDSSEINNVIKDYFLEGDDEPINFLPNFSGINVIVGANNSGKSRFLRYLMSYKSITGINEFKNVEFLMTEYNSSIEKLQSLTRQEIARHANSANNALNHAQQDRELKHVQHLQSNSLSGTNFKTNNAYQTIEKNNEVLNNLKPYGIDDDLINNYNKVDQDYFKKFKEIKRYYIPTLRTAHSLFQHTDVAGYKKIEEDIFLETLNKYYNLDELDVEVFTGIHLYKDILNSRNSKREIRQRFENFEEFIRKNFFGNKKIDIVAEFDKDESLKGNNHLEIISVHIEGEKDTRNLHELGDGIQSIIILMYKIFMAEANSFIFIDEPEINLHPGMQRLFLEQICTNSDLKKKNLVYIISTHSNHFLDLTIEKDNVSIYSFSTRNLENGEKQFVIKNVNSGDNQLLKELGVNNSSVFMANCSIWVEGISDRNYIKAFLKAYCNYTKKLYPKEDIDFAFFEYAGSNYTHYNFSEEEDTSKIKAFALNNRILFISDVDENKCNKHKHLYELAKENFQYKTTEPFREVENLLTNEVWSKVLVEFRNKSKFKIDEEGKIQEKISKALLKHDHADYNEQYIGVFLKKLNISELNKLWEGTETKPQTFAYKTDLSNHILDKVNNKIITWDDFKTNPTIVELTEGIFNFIMEK